MTVNGLGCASPNAHCRPMAVSVDFYLKHGRAAVRCLTTFIDKWMNAWRTGQAGSSVQFSPLAKWAIRGTCETIQQRSASSLFCGRSSLAVLAYAGMLTLSLCPFIISSASRGIIHPSRCSEGQFLRCCCGAWHAHPLQVSVRLAYSHKFGNCELWGESSHPLERYLWVEKDSNSNWTSCRVMSILALFANRHAKCKLDLLDTWCSQQLRCSALST